MATLPATRRGRTREAVRYLREILSLPSRDGAVVGLAAGLLLWYRIRLVLLGPRGSRRFLHRRIMRSRVERRSPGVFAPAHLARLAGLFRRAVGSGIVGAGCVPRSLALARFLGLHGLPAEIRIGVRRSNRGFTGHAWVEHHGAVIAEARGFVALVAASVGVVWRPDRAAGAP